MTKDHNARNWYKIACTVRMCNSLYEYIPIPWIAKGYQNKTDKT